MFTSNGKRFADALIETVTLILVLAVLSSFLISSSCNSDGNSSLDPELVERLEQVLAEKMKEFGIPGALANLFPLLVNISAVPYINLAGIFIIDRYFTSIF